MASLLIAAVPKFVVLESPSTRKYLIVKNDTDTVRFDGEDILKPDVKFELELESSNAAGTPKELVHIRSCYNNKYLVARPLVPPEYLVYIFAGADKPEEDQSKDTCTLFKIEDGLSKDQFVFSHVQVGGVPPISISVEISYTCLVVNWDSLVVLPKHIAFKDRNGNYLRARTIEKHPYHQFDGDTRDQTVEYEVTSIGNGCVRIKSLFHGKYWRRSPNWIWADSSDESSNHPDVLFHPIKIDNDVVALRNMGNNYFCKSLTTEGKTNCLNAGTPTISTDAELVVEELVVSRSINHVDYDLSRARVYGQTIIALATTGTTNDSYESEAKNLMLGLNYKNIETNSWNHSISVMAGLSVTFEAGIPFIVSGEVEIQVEATYTHEWGKTKTTETEITTSYTVTVPPRTKTKVTLIATKGLCDVPFSYNQTDILSNGEQVTKSMKDGIYVGSNYFDFRYEEEQTKL